MRYTVRTQDGELTYDGLQALQAAAAAGWVDPDDEVREEGTTVWKKAATLPGLAQARLPKPGAKTLRTQRWTIAAFVGLGGVALYGIASGRFYIGVLGGLLLAGLSIRVATVAFLRPRG